MYLKKGQVSIEFLMILASVLIILIIMVSLSDQRNLISISQKDQLNSKTISEGLAQNINDVYLSGNGVTKIVNLPSSLKSTEENYVINIYPKKRIVDIQWNSFGNIDHYSSPLITNQIIGNLTNVSNQVTIRNYNGVVVITHNSSQITSYCGDSIIDVGEECDNNNFNGLTCVDFGFDYGNLICSLTCVIINTSCEYYDLIPPNFITNLQNVSSGINWIYWNWTNPSDSDFLENIIFIDGINVLNTSNNYYNATGLSSNMEYTITVHTKDLSNNINDTDVNNTAFTKQNVTVDTLKMEWNTVSAGNLWRNVNLVNNYENPVIITAPIYSNNLIPLVVRICNATTNSFKIKLQNPSGSLLSNETVNYLVVEEGNWTLPDGKKLEAFTVSSTQTSYKNNWGSSVMINVGYVQSYTNPVVLGQVMSYNDSLWSVFWSSSGSSGSPPTSSNLYVNKHVGEDTNTVRSNEILGYIVIESGSGTINDISYLAGVGLDTVRGIDNSPPYSYTVLGTFNVGIVTQVAMDGGDGSWGLFYGSSPFTTNQIDLVVDEDQVANGERSHTTEQINYLLFNSSGGYS